MKIDPNKIDRVVDLREKSAELASLTSKRDVNHHHPNIPVDELTTNAQRIFEYLIQDLKSEGYISSEE